VSAAIYRPGHPEGTVIESRIIIPSAIFHSGRSTGEPSQSIIKNMFEGILTEKGRGCDTTPRF